MPSANFLFLLACTGFRGYPATFLGSFGSPRSDCFRLFKSPGMRPRRSGFPHGIPLRYVNPFPGHTGLHYLHTRLLLLLLGLLFHILHSLQIQYLIDEILLLKGLHTFYLQPLPNFTQLG